jgi:L-lactate dehydrogenase (cytochrome)
MILNMPSSLPIFISPAALARLGHPDGEMNLVRAAGKAGILQGVRHKIKEDMRRPLNWQR